MNKHLIALALAAFIPTGPLLHAADQSKPDYAKIGKQLTGSLVIVEYELQYDNADAPEGGLGAERCPGCGQYHGNDLRAYLEEERPVEAVGYLVAPDCVVTKDPQVHARFIKSIRVRYQDQKSAATIHAFAKNQRGVLLSLATPLNGSAPLQFTATKTIPQAMVDLTWHLGQWSVIAMPYAESVLTPPSGAAYRRTQNTGVAVSTDGTLLGIILDGKIPLDHSWQGSPLNWPQDTAETVAKNLNALGDRARAAILRVHLTFRSPKAKGDAGRYGSSYFRSPGSELGEDTTEADVSGALLPGGKLLVLANLTPKLTARLERIEAHPATGAVITARFDATLKDFGAFVATHDTPENAVLMAADGDVVRFGDELLLRADVTIRGEAREEHVQTAHFSSFKRGPKELLYPQMDGQDPQNAFVFDSTGKLLALSISRRRHDNGAESRYSSATIDLAPAAEILAAVKALPATADLSNIPVSEADENRLAWLGVELQPMNQELARANNVSTQTRDGETGALVTYVHPDSPAAKAGLSVGSILLRLKVQGRPLPVEVHLEDDSMRAQGFPWDRLDEVPAQYFDRIPSPWSPVENEFVRALTDLGFGTRYTLEFFANGKLELKDLNVTVGPTDFNSAPRYKSESLGITVRDVTYEVRRYLQRKADEPGVVISKVEPGARAGVAGVRPFELITHVNDQPVNTVKEFEKLTAPGGELKLSIKRMAKGRIVTIKPAS